MEENKIAASRIYKIAAERVTLEVQALGSIYAYLVHKNISGYSKVSYDYFPDNDLWQFDFSPNVVRLYTVNSISSQDANSKI